MEECNTSFPSVIVGDISINIEDPLIEFIKKISDSFDTLRGQYDTTSVDTLKLICVILLRKIEFHKSNGCNEEQGEELIKLHDVGRSILLSMLNDPKSTEEIRIKILNSLYELLPHQALMGKKPLFPDYHLGIILSAIITYEGDISKFVSSLQNILNYDDVSRNLWKGLEIACCKLNKCLSPQDVSHVLSIINCTEKPKSKEGGEAGPTPYFCRVPDGIASDKDIGTSIKRVWDKLVSVELPQKQMQTLLLTLYERLMPRMNKPIFLTDYFMTSLEIGGPISLLALQGIFTLIQKYNMNYPDVYEKIYSMLSVDIFGTPYKARFYYLTDMFLSSSHLPEALVAGFIKKFARLSLLAPPVDVIIMMAFIVNLMIRHPGLKKLVHNPTDITYENDPYNFEEKDPALSRAIESSLWEVVIHQSHALPAVSSAALFINNNLPATERDLSDLLEMTSDQMFAKEFKKKMKTPPVAFEKPTSLYVPNVKSGLALWNFNS